MIRPLLRSQSGFSIIQGMFLAAAVAGMAYVGTKLTTDQKLAQKGVESKGRVEQLHGMIYAILQNNKHCTKTYNDNAVTIDTRRISCGPACMAMTRIIDDPVMQITTDGSTTPAFTTKDFTSGVLQTYMGNSVTVNRMQMTWDSYAGQDHAELRITYGKLDSVTDRTGQGFGGKEITKSIKLKLQINPVTNVFESCYAVDEAQNADMIKDFCTGLRSDGNPAIPNIFEWDDDYKKCVLQDISCEPGQVFTGYDSNGIKQCYAINEWMNFGDLIDTTSVSACNAKNSSEVKFVIVGNKAQIQCSTTGPCTQNCQCSGTQYCASGACREIGLAGSACDTNTPCLKVTANDFFTCPSGTWIHNSGAVNPAVCPWRGSGTPCP